MELTKEHRKALLYKLKQTQESIDVNNRDLHSDVEFKQETIAALEIDIFLNKRIYDLIFISLSDNDIDY